MKGTGLFIKGLKMTQQNWYPLPQYDYVQLRDKDVVCVIKGVECGMTLGEKELFFEMLVEDVWDIVEEDSNVDQKAVVA